MTRTSLTFGLGLLTALAAGWFAFPRALYVRHEQPLAFRHKTHAEKSGVAECADCHTLGEDGTFSGIPKQESCTACHTEPMKANSLVHSRQPANVWFSHAVHIRRAKLECADCHGTDGTSDRVPAYEQDRISSYGRQVMQMSACEDCHRQRQVETGCLGCHQ